MGDKIRISFGFYIFLALLILLLPIQWWLGALLAALIHEGFHVLAILLCRGDILSVTVTGLGAKIDASPMSTGKQVFCVLAGPVGSFSCLIASECFPELALCGFVQGAYNLLPIYPLDGGRALGCICPAPVCKGIEWFTMVILTGASLWLIVQNREVGAMFLISACYPVIQRKISCKEGILAVQ